MSYCDSWDDEIGCDDGHWHAQTKRLPWGHPEVLGTVQQVYCSPRGLLRRGLEFHACTINKSLHTKKVWNLIVCSLYIYIYIYIIIINSFLFSYASLYILYSHFNFKIKNKSLNWMYKIFIHYVYTNKILLSYLSDCSQNFHLRFFYLPSFLKSSNLNWIFFHYYNYFFLSDKAICFKNIIIY